MTTQDAIQQAVRAGRGDIDVCGLNTSWAYWQGLYAVVSALGCSLTLELAADLSAGIVPLIPTGITLDEQTRAALAYCEGNDNSR